MRYVTPKLVARKKKIVKNFFFTIFYPPKKKKQSRIKYDYVNNDINCKQLKNSLERKIVRQN